MHKIPEPEDVIANLSPISGVFYEGLEFGAFKAKSIWAKEIEKVVDSEPICPFWGPHTLRLFAKRKMIELGRIVTDEYDGAKMGTESVPNNGLCTSFLGYRIRILKSDRGRLPVPSSVDRISFYAQQGWLPNMEADLPAPELANLVITWDVDSDYNLQTLLLFMPKTGGRKRHHISEYWQEPIPYPENFLRQSKTETTEPPADDLPYERKDVEEDEDEGKKING